MAASSLSWRLWVDQLSGPGQPVQVTPPPPPSAVDIWSVGCIMAEMLTGFNSILTSASRVTLVLPIPQPLWDSVAHMS